MQWHFVPNHPKRKRALFERIKEFSSTKTLSSQNQRNVNGLFQKAVFVILLVIFFSSSSTIPFCQIIFSATSSHSGLFSKGALLSSLSLCFFRVLVYLAVNIISFFPNFRVFQLFFIFLINLIVHYIITMSTLH